MSANLLGALAGILTMLGFVPYIWSVLKKGAKPNRATWIIWSIVNFLNLIGYYYTAETGTIWLVLADFIGMTIVALLSFKYGVEHWTKTDKACLAGAGASILLWQIPGSALWAFGMSVISDAFGAVPTIFKAYADPRSEDSLAWLLFTVGGLVNIIAVETWSYGAFFFNFYVVIASGTILVCSLRRKK